MRYYEVSPMEEHHPTTHQETPTVTSSTALVGLPATGRTWVDEPSALAEKLRAAPGDPRVPDDHPEAGWQVVGWSDNPAHRAKMAGDAIRIRTKLDGGDPNRKVLRAFHVGDDGSIFQAHVSSDPVSPGREHTVELHARFLPPEQAAYVHEQIALIRGAGGKRLAYRAVRRDETPIQRGMRVASSAAKRRAAVAARNATTEGTSQ
jgi:hypothetical protein